ncbi:MAG: ATP-binding protein [Pegethrix bostrychoides GSE-TBD4-15B]|jgi:hypothetical protein|uniref:ATP-binding protein n=1 Tax=Pegethrix bostrychoides GSE-TBD4-15B TaxID=2839662 RepID=A0A951PAG0_9CYAN|nr:ATP-binding protein [Pegethrix bostrychoides GSE-TBD4-15B]
MEAISKRMQELIQQPQESLSVELKSWIDPDQPHDISKIVKAALAMRNHGGGYIIIGFDNKTREPLIDDAPLNVRELFHIDKIQGMIAKYSSEAFEVDVQFPQRNGQDFPVINIPTGIKTPVASKKELPSTDRNKPLIDVDTIYVRSLSSNNTPSTTKAQSKDWDRLIEICFDNREADIGRFIRRHLGGVGSEQLNSLATAFAGNLKSEVSTEDLLRAYFNESEKYYEQAVFNRKVELPKRGFREVGLILIGEIPDHSPNQAFLNLLDSSNPNYTGWPVWLDSRQFPANSRPYVNNGAWEALLIDLERSWGSHIDFMRLDPQGKFFLRRALEDDMQEPDRSPRPLTVLDWGLSIIRTAEAIAVGIAFAISMGCLPEKTTLAFGFKWSGLKGRKISSWANPRRVMFHSYSAYQDEVIVFVNVPLDTPLSALSQYVSKVIKPLFETFEGFTLGEDIIEEMTRSLIERRL